MGICHNFVALLKGLGAKHVANGSGKLLKEIIGYKKTPGYRIIKAVAHHQRTVKNYFFNRIRKIAP